MEEWNQIVEKICSAGLRPLSSEIKLSQDIPYLWADYVYAPSGQRFAKYLFTYITAEQWRRWPQWDDDFVREVIEPVYFQQIDDTSWNIYWISVMPEHQLHEMDIQQRITFSSNTEYTRNLIVPMEHLSDAIPVGHIKARDGGEELRDPADDWLQQLEPEALEFCLREFSQKAFDSYLGGEMRQRDTPRKPPDTAPGRQLNALESIRIPQEFRPHYYPKEWIIPFRAVNLLYGSNGSGKTSLLSAIELAMTGEVRGLSPGAGGSYPTPADVILTIATDTGNNMVRPPREAKEKKLLEQQWYRDRSTKRIAPQLQNLFHQFNYLSVEETFLFANQQPNLSNIFSKILFGPETSDMWRNHERYLDECGKTLTNLDSFLAQLTRLDRELPSVSPANETAFRAYITTSGLKLNPNGTPNDILFHVETVLAEYDKVKELAPIPSQEALRQEYELRCAQRAELEDQIRTHKGTLQELDAAVQQLKNDVESLQTNSDRENAALCVFRAAEPLCKQFLFYNSNLDAVEYYQKLDAEAKQRASQLKLLLGLSDQHSVTLQASPTRSLEDIQAEMRELHNRNNALTQEHRHLQNQIEQGEALQAQHDQLLAYLHATGQKIYQMDPKRTTCPLCGTDGITQEFLLAHLAKVSSEDSRQLQALYDKANQLKDECAVIGSRLKELGREQNVAQGYRQALQAIRVYFPQIQTFAALQREIEGAQNRVAEADKQLTDVGAFLHTQLRESKLDAEISDILSSRERLQNQLQTAIIAFPAESSDEALAAWLIAEPLQRKKTLDELAEKLRDAEDARKQKFEQYGRLNDDLNHLQKELDRTEKDMRHLKQLRLFWDHVKSITEDLNLSGDTLQAICSNIAEQARNLMEYREFQTTKGRYQSNIEQTKQMRERCRHLQKSLKELASPETYATWFIQKNIDQISQIFLALHSPQEFSGLAQSDDGGLVALRNGESIPVSLMSTGQRTALVISVFFQMNLATPYAPKFLLLDEPVANIDDLNILALMDFLRELVIIHKRQIFFTTANRNVARLFRRKFSFLLQDFQELRFLRAKEQHLEITRHTYDQSRSLESTGL